MRRVIGGIVCIVVTGAAITVTCSQPAVAVTPPASAPTTLPATEPAGAAVDVRALIKQLGADDADSRDLAQAKLVTLGQAAVSSLKAAGDDPDPEVRSRAAAALAAIEADDNFGATRVTLHLREAPGADAISELAKQAHTQIHTALPYPLKPLTLDSDRKPFWEVLLDLCRQESLLPSLDMTGRTINLEACGREELERPDFQVNGPFLIGIEGVNLHKTVNLMGPHPVENSFSIRMVVYPEPKLSISRTSRFIVDDAVDDAGNSLVNPAAAGSTSLTGWGMLTAPHNVTVRLDYPARPGTKVSLLHGHLSTLLARDYQQCRFEDVLSTPKIDHEVEGCKVRVSVANPSPQFKSQFLVSLTCVRAGATDAQWESMSGCGSQLTLLDDKGQELNTQSAAFQNPGKAREGAPNFTVDRTFTSSALPAINHQLAHPKTGDPVRLIWSFASSSKSASIPFTFKDIPIP